MELLYINGSFYPDNSGGPTITMYWMAKSLHDRGVKIKVLTTNRGIPATINTNCWVDTDFGKAQYVRTLKNIIPVTLFLKSLLILPKTKNLYLVSFFYPLSFLIAPIALLFGVKVFWAPRGETSDAALKFGRFRKKIVLQLIKIFKNKIIFHATSPAEFTDILNALGKCKIELIPIGMEIPKQIKTNIEKSKDLIFLGRIHPIKGLENLIKALALSADFIKSKHQLLIAGYPQLGYDKYLINLANTVGVLEKIKFIGKVDGQEKDILLANSFALILPSFSENFGAVIAESLAQGTPCIASKGTPWSILETFNAGLFISNDPISLSNAINYMMSICNEDYYEMRQNARTLAETVLDVNINADKWLQLISDR